MEYTLHLIGMLFTICCVQVKSLPNIAIRQGQTFEVKLNLTSEPEDVSFVRLENQRNQLFIRDILVHYLYPEGVIENTDSRVSLFGNVEEGEAWFLFKNITSTDSGLYGILYKMMHSADVFNKTFELHVTKVLRKERPTVPDFYILTWNPSTEAPTEPENIAARKKSNGAKQCTKGFKLLFLFIIIIHLFKN